MKKPTPDEVKKKILRYCTYQERSHYEVKNKLYGYGLFSSEVNELVSYLITEGFLSEERFARAFAGGKFRMKKWGRIKIVRELERHNLTANCIRLGLKEIEDGDYQQTLSAIIQRKAEQSADANLFIKRDKIARYTIQKGFEPELVWAEIKRQLPG